MVSGELPQIGGATGSVVQRLAEQVSVISQKKKKKIKLKSEISFGLK